jgi:hypothetical protein
MTWKVGRWEVIDVRRCRPSGLLLIATTLFVALFTACSKGADSAAPVAEVAVTIDRSAVEAGAPLDVHYRFTRLAGDAAPPADALVFVHMVDAAGTLLWTDDHRPPVPTSQWGTGTAADYHRTMFVPRNTAPGAVQVQAGLYVPKDGARVPLRGSEKRARAYSVATFDVKAPAGTFVVFGDGWYGAEQTEQEAARPWRWSKGEARVSFRNPRADAVLSLELDQPVAQVGAQTLELRAGSELLETIAVMPGNRRVQRVNLPANRLGGEDVVELTLTVHPTFVPATIADLRSSDSRELGVRLFNIHVGPAGH